MSSSPCWRSSWVTVSQACPASPRAGPGPRRAWRTARRGPLPGPGRGFPPGRRCTARGPRPAAGPTRVDSKDPAPRPSGSPGGRSSVVTRRPGRHRRQVTGRGDLAGAARRVDDRVDAGGERGIGQARGHLVQPAQHLPGRQLQVGQGMRRGPQLDHDRGGLRAVPHRVADDQRRPAAGQRDDVVPVAADHARADRQVPVRDLEPGGTRGSPGSRPCCSAARCAVPGRRAARCRCTPRRGRPARPPG